MSRWVRQCPDLSRLSGLSGFRPGSKGIRSAQAEIPNVAPCRVPSSRVNACHPVDLPDGSSSRKIQVKGK